MVAVNAEATFGRVDPTCHGLRELPSAEGHGLLFATLSPGADFTLERHLGSLGDHSDRAHRKSN